MNGNESKITHKKNAEKFRLPFVCFKAKNIKFKWELKRIKKSFAIVEK